MDANATNPTSSAQPRRWVKPLAAVAAALLLGLLVFWGVDRTATGAGRAECAAIDADRAQGVIFTNPSVARKDPMLFCACLSEAARRTSSNWMLAALIIGGLGALCTLCGGALGPEPNAAPGTFRAQRGILLTGIGALLVTFAIYCNARATVASNVAADAHNALTLADAEEVFTACVRAKSAWIASRAESAALIFDHLATPGQRAANDVRATATPAP